MSGNLQRFTAQADDFLAIVLAQRGYKSLVEAPDLTARATFPVPPVVIEDTSALTTRERTSLIESYRLHGVAYFVCPGSRGEDKAEHPLFRIAKQLTPEINLRYPYRESATAVGRAHALSSPTSATVKVFDKSQAVGAAALDVSETSAAFDAHFDGLGSGNTVENFILYCESAPLAGGFTLFFDVLGLALNLAQRDLPAFRSLFRPDAVTVFRREGTIRIVGPVLYLDDDEQPNSFFRKDGGEYIMQWHQGDAHFDRARAYLSKSTEPFAQGSCFVCFAGPGHGTVSRNFGYVHGRTSFINGSEGGQTRILTKKWFMKSAAHQERKKVPGLCMSANYASLFPEYFAPDKLAGEWEFDRVTGQNRRIQRC